MNLQLAFFTVMGLSLPACQAGVAVSVDKNGDTVSPSSEPSGETDTATDTAAEPSAEPSVDPSTEPAVEPTAEPTAEPSSADPCDNPNTIEYQVQFSQKYDACQWGSNGNQNAINGLYNARDEDEIIVTHNGIICDMDVSFNNSNGTQSWPNFSYDDQVILTWNDHVIAGSNRNLVRLLLRDDYSRAYDWNAIKGLPMDYGEDSWAPSNSLADFPNVDNATGTLSLALDSGLVSQLVTESLTQQQASFKMITFGDNDTGDCSHAAWDFTVTLSVGR